MPKFRRGAAAILLLASTFVLTACSSLLPPATTDGGTTGATGSPGGETATAAGPDWLLIGMVVLLGVMVFFMFRNSRKRKAEQEKLKSTMAPGVEVMTNFGLFGTIIEIDVSANTAILEVSPGNRVKVHRQTLVRVVEEPAPGEPRSVEEAMEIADREQRERDAAAGEPEFGERIDPEDEGDQKK